LPIVTTPVAAEDVEDLVALVVAPFLPLPSKRRMRCRNSGTVKSAVSGAHESWSTWMQYCTTKITLYRGSSSDEAQSGVKSLAKSPLRRKPRRWAGV
jgi:hypothetical protein